MTAKSSKRFNLSCYAFKLSTLDGIQQYE